MNTMIDTSTVSYEKCKDEGLISERQLQVMRFILSAQEAYPDGISRGDVARYFNDTQTGYARRVQELEVAGILECIGTKNDPITNRPVKTYVPTGIIPTERVTSVIDREVKIRIWWCQTETRKYGPFFYRKDAMKLSPGDIGPGRLEVVSEIVTAEKV